MTRVHAVEEAPTDGLGRLAASAAAVKIAASALRFLAAGAVSFAGLLVVALLLSSFDRTVQPVRARATSMTSAWL